jgi:hypothetical protein
MRNKTLQYFVAYIQQSKKLTPKEKNILIQRIERTPLRLIAQTYNYKDEEHIRHLEQLALYKLFRFIL